MNQPNPLRHRLGLFSGILALGASFLTCHLVSLYMGVPTPFLPFFNIDLAYFAETALTQYGGRVTIQPPRGEIYDQHGVLLATNSVEYEIGLSPALVYDGEETARALSEILGIPQEDVAEAIESDLPWVQLFSPAPSSMGQALLTADISGVTVTPMPRRYYPHGSLAAHVIGFVNYQSSGFYGIEGYYDDALGGKVSVDDQSRIPFEATSGEGWENGSDLYLTLDSEIQNLAETTLALALQEYGAKSGTIIVADPRTGAILAIANAPTFDPNRFYAESGQAFSNAAISLQYEPGSTAKVLTMAVALENEIVEPNSTYNDVAVLEVGGVAIQNWDRKGHGITSMTDLLGKSLNVGAATLSLQLGPSRFYDGLAAFGLGQPTGIDLEGEIAGSLKRPGSANWFESDLGTNSYGQGLAVTPIQLITAVGSIANQGLIMKPHIVARRINTDGTVVETEPSVNGRSVSVETANQLSQMLIVALQREASPALVPGYALAGKTGTAQIPIPGGYDPEFTIHSFIGWGPVDDPQFIVLIKLDQPDPTRAEFGSQSAAPTFNYLASRLVVLMEIPPDNLRTGR